MHTYKKTQIILLSLGAGLLSNCGSPTILGSMEGVSVESDRSRAGLLSGLDQVRTTNVSGMLPFHDVGQIYKMKRGRKPSLAIPVCEGESKIVTISYESDASMSELYAIREAIMDVRVKVASYSLTTIQRATLESEAAILAGVEEGKKTEGQKARFEVDP